MDMGGRSSEINFSEVFESARELGIQAQDALTSGVGGALEGAGSFIFNWRRGAGLKKLLLLSVLLSACAPVATPTQGVETPAPIVTSEPVEQPPVISTEPAGFGLSPTPSPESAPSNAEFFIAPTSADVAKYMAGEFPIPDPIKDYVAAFKEKMEKKRAEIASSCVVPESEIEFSFIDNGLDGDKYRWAIGVVAGGQVCWPVDANTSQLGAYPAYFDAEGELMSVAQGVQWERIDGTFAFAGTKPIIANASSYILPEGLTGTIVGDPNSWKKLATASENINLVENPLSDQDMNVFLAGNFRFDSEAGVLKSETGQNVASYYDGAWRDTVTGAEIADFKAVSVAGVDYEGNAIGSIATRTLNGEAQLFNPDIGEWVRKIDLKSGQDMMDYDGTHNKLDAHNWGTFENITLEGMPEITQQEAENGTWFYNEQLNLRPEPKNVRALQLQCVKFNDGNYWHLSEFPDGIMGVGFYVGNTNRVREAGETPINWENDPIQNLSVVKYKDNTGAWNIKQGLQYWIDGRAYVLNVKYWGENADPTNPEFINTQMALANPRWNVVEPWCNDNKVFDLMPQGFKDLYAKEEKNPTPPSQNGEAFKYITFDLDVATIARLQGATFEDAYMEKNLLQFYLRPLNDPAWKETFPDMEVPSN